jgi:hypothetical protein
LKESRSRASSPSFAALVVALLVGNACASAPINARSDRIADGSGGDSSPPSTSGQNLPSPAGPGGGSHAGRSGCVLSGTVSGAPWMRLYPQGGSAGAGGGPIGGSLVDWSAETTFGNDGFLYAQGTVEVDGGLVIAGGPLGMALLLLPTDSPAPKKPFCATSGSFHLATDPSISASLSLTGLVGLPSCPGPTTVAGEVHYCLGAQCEGGLSGDLDDRTLGPTTANFSGSSSGSSSSIILAASDQSFVFVLEATTSPVSAVRTISGLAYTAAQDAGAGNFYCVGAGTISGPSANGSVEQIDFGQFSKLGPCDQDQSNSLDIACN